MFKTLATPIARLSLRSVAVARSFPAVTQTRASRFFSNELAADSPVTSYGADPIVRYSSNHEWVAAHKDNVAFVGITKYAADALGETTFVEVIDVPSNVAAEDTIGSVESVKSASDLYSPAGGELIEANQNLIDNPTLVNSDPMGAAWFAKIKLSNPKDLDSLMTLEKYEEFLKEAH